MLEKLSSVLKKTTDKIANAIFLDKNLVDSIVKDLQRALIEADVNVSLVLEVTQKIKKAALDERIKGLEKKEHIIKLLHDELIALLGEKREIKLQKENTFMLVGLYGAGKCVHGKSKIQLADGNIVSAQELYGEYNGALKGEKLEDGEIINLENEELFVPSFNPKTAKIENKKVTHLWKLSKENLMEICLENGNDYSIKVTPEHPFFVLRQGKITKVRADEMEESDFIAIPKEVKIEGKLQSLWENVRKLDLLVCLNKEETQKIISSKKETLRKINSDLKYKTSYCNFTVDLKSGKIPIELLYGGSKNYLEIKGHKEQKIITMPLFLTSEFAEFLGYVMGDGNISSRYVQIANEDTEVIERIRELSRLLFNIEPTIKHAKRTKKMYDIRICSGTLVKILAIFGLRPGKKGKELKIPSQILLSDNEVVRSFIRAYFDCDSSPALDRRNIELTSESQPLIQQMNLLLKRFGIISTISRRIIKEIPYWRLTIKARYAEEYASKVGCLIERKQKRLDSYKQIGIIQGCGDQDMIPVGKILRELRTRLGFSIGEIQTNAVYSYGIYEESGYISREKLQKLIAYYLLKNKGIYLSVLENISNNINLNKKYSNAFINGITPTLKSNDLIERSDIPTLSQKGQQYLTSLQENKNQELIDTLKTLSNSDVCWLPIKKINTIKNDSKYVYDLTVEDNHSFIADGFIVHNTTTISKLASYYSKRGSKVCAVGLDVHRPAASEQLKQLCDKLNITCFISPEEKDPKKIWKKFEKDLKDYSLVIVDTAGRDSLDSDLIKEIKDISKLVKPTETFLVMAADIGQTAKKQAQAFKDAVNITGVIITRMDSTAKAGGALTACAEVKSPVVFIGTGEKPADLEQFNPESFLSRLLGMGDLESLMEKIHSVVDQKQIEETQKKLQEGKFTLKDLQTQMESMESIGSMDKIMSMIPGLGKAKIPQDALETQQQKMKNWKNAISSMTKEEVENPEVLEKQTSRIQRISKGSGVSTSDIRALLKQYKMLNEMIKSQVSLQEGQMDQKAMMKLVKKFGRKMKF